MIYEEPLPLDDPSTFYNDTLYRMYNDIVYELFPDLLDIEAKSSDTLVLVIRSPSPSENHDSLNRTAYKDLLSKAIEALHYQVTNTINKLHAKQGLDSSRAFLSTLSTLYKLLTEDFAYLYISIYHASTSFYLNTLLTNDARSPLINLSKEEKTRKLAKGI
jgi:hypothetical protein